MIIIKLIFLNNIPSLILFRQSIPKSISIEVLGAQVSLLITNNNNNIEIKLNRSIIRSNFFSFEFPRNESG